MDERPDQAVIDRANTSLEAAIDNDERFEHFSGIVIIVKRSTVTMDQDECLIQVAMQNITLDEMRMAHIQLGTRIKEMFAEALERKNVG